MINFLKVLAFVGAAISLPVFLWFVVTLMLLLENYPT